MPNQEDSLFDSVGPWVVVSILVGLVLVVIIQAWRALRKEWNREPIFYGNFSGQPREQKRNQDVQLQVVVLNPAGSISMGTHPKL